jgi:hypothetical protein
MQAARELFEDWIYICHRVQSNEDAASVKQQIF